MGENGTNDNDNNDADAKHINLTVKSQQFADVHFKIKKSTTFKKLFDAYCQRNHLDHQVVRFLYDEQRIRPENTPLSLDMEEGDIIQVFQEQLAGGCGSSNCGRVGGIGRDGNICGGDFNPRCQISFRTWL